MRRIPAATRMLAGSVLAAGLGGCGLDVQSADLFVLTRTGQAQKLTLLVSDGGTIACNGGRPKPISSPRLIQARDLSDNLAKDAAANLDLRPVADSVFYYRIKLQQGTVSFPDRAAPGHTELADAELFAVRAATQVCGLPG